MTGAWDRASPGTGPRPGGIVIRRASRDDIGALVDLARRAWLDTYTRLIPAADIAAFVTGDHAALWIDRTWRGIHVAERRDTLLGFVEVVDDTLAELWVGPFQQGRGVGGQLLAFAEARMAGNGHARGRLETLLANRRAQAFYRRHGWTPAGVSEMRFSTSVQQNLIMFKSLRNTGWPLP